MRQLAECRRPVRAADGGDSLRYWVTEMRVDGFRFDLAPTLAREQGGFDRLSAFFDLVSQDPVVSRAKLIAEPWDVVQRWYTPAGEIVTAEEWADPGARSVAIYLDGVDEPDHAEDGTLLLDDDFLVLVNAWWEPLEFVIPPTRDGQVWEPELDSFEPTGVCSPAKLGAGDPVSVNARSLVVLRGPVTGP